MRHWTSDSMSWSKLINVLLLSTGMSADNVDLVRDPSLGRIKYVLDCDANIEIQSSRVQIPLRSMDFLRTQKS